MLFRSQDIGFKDVRETPGAAEALVAVRTDRVHLIISDYNMPDMDGVAFLKEVREQKKEPAQFLFVDKITFNQPTRTQRSLAPTGRCAH